MSASAKSLPGGAGGAESHGSKTLTPAEVEWKLRIHERLLQVMDLTLIGTVDEERARHEIAEIVQRKMADLNARDLMHVAVMLENGISYMLSTDKHFDQHDEVRRIDPRDFPQG